MPFFFGVGSHTDTAHRGTAKRDTAGGVAGLNAVGTLLAQGSAVQLRRDGSDRVYITERSALENVLRATRIGADDFQASINETGTFQRIQTASMKNAANGIAGLDANTELDITQLRPCVEKYNNHYGVAYECSSTAVSGNGTATSDATNHEMDLSTGITIAGSARFQTKMNYTLGTRPWVANFIHRNRVAGVGITGRWTLLGICNSFTSTDFDNPKCGFLAQGTTWKAVTASGTARTETTVTVADGDLLTVVATSSQALYFVNSTLVATHTTNIPTASLRVGAGVVAAAGGLTTAESGSLDMMGYERFY